MLSVDFAESVDYADELETVIKSNKDTIKILEEKVMKAEGSALKSYEQSKNDNLTLKTVNKNLNTEVESLKKDKNLCIGDNLPYSGDLPGDTLDRHCINAGHKHVLIEIRNDLFIKCLKIHMLFICAIKSSKLCSLLSSAATFSSAASSSAASSSASGSSSSSSACILGTIISMKDERNEDILTLKNRLQIR